MAFWEAYWRVEPWGGEYHRHAELCRLIEQVAGAGDKANPYERWMPADWDSSQIEHEPAPIEKQLEAVKQAFG